VGTVLDNGNESANRIMESEIKKGERGEVPATTWLATGKRVGLRMEEVGIRGEKSRRGSLSMLSPIEAK